MVLVLHIIASEFLIPWDPTPESRKPWNGKWSGPLAGGPFTCSTHLRHFMRTNAKRTMKHPTKFSQAAPEDNLPILQSTLCSAELNHALIVGRKVHKAGSRVVVAEQQQLLKWLQLS